MQGVSPPSIVTLLCSEEAGKIVDNGVESDVPLVDDDEMMPRGQVSSFTKAKRVTKPQIVIYRKKSGPKK